MLHAAKGHSPIWFYQFAYKGEYSYGNLFAATNETIDFEWGKYAVLLIKSYNEPARFFFYLHYHTWTLNIHMQSFICFV